MVMRTEDLIISVAYFSIPLQLVAALTYYPRLRSMPLPILGLFILFALFILCCGTGHVLRCVGLADSHIFFIVNWITAIVSITTAVSLLPMVPSLMSELDEGLERLRKLDEVSQSAGVSAQAVYKDYHDDQV